MNTSRKKAVTLADVAAAAGVSRSTASRALNHSPRISKGTTERIEALATTMGFVPNAQGRALASGRAEAIAILVTEPLNELFTDPTYGAFIGGITAKLAQTSYLPMLLQASSDDERQRVKRHLECRSFDAVIDISPYTDSYLLDIMNKLHTPGVLLGQITNERYQGMFSVVYSDDTKGAKLAAQTIVDRGRKHPVAIVGPRDNPASQYRIKGYASVFGTKLSPDSIIYTQWDAAAGFAAMMQILSQKKPVDAVLAGSDRIAVGVLEALKQYNLQVPDDVSVIGFDDHNLAQTTTPSLTTIHQPLYEEGQLAAELAMKMIEGQEPITSILQMKLVIRDSV
ncbi:LacI family DNA-binding transcriptional regulator [Gardnerella vaginalis]|uniref:LacI family DNA-binding transcriptional regulator n=1 Tax=Gardnerella vaginalis TaxID=2702 RepID=A0AAW6XYA8_GARVA|nr:LacI family DNA-binding transcriptional regulator [Gardnerella vaginalis]MDK7063349.1 LacI family DNA-binding transcriptional regulator [Gardnerella vaginalis]NSX30047.1 LacI family DNA-binding transcriptional regulator [Gardnerella vaginalis]PKZ47461.1 LacI family transcriptional regulator [Gardnerella vaginalis]CQB86745.1 Ribose operon repressor [Chlamydia trachomatis]